MNVDTNFGQVGTGWWWGVWQDGRLVGFGAWYHSKSRCFRHQDDCMKAARERELPTVECTNPNIETRQHRRHGGRREAVRKPFNTGFANYPVREPEPTELDKLLTAVKKHCEPLADAAGKLSEIRASLVVNCMPGRTLNMHGCSYDESKSVHANLIAILEILTKPTSANETGEVNYGLPKELR